MTRVQRRARARRDNRSWHRAKALIRAFARLEDHDPHLAAALLSDLLKHDAAPLVNAECPTCHDTIQRTKAALDAMQAEDETWAEPEPDAVVH